MRVLRWAGRFWTGVLAVTVALAGLLIGLRLLLPLFDAPPTLHDASPADRAQSVVPRVRLVLRFDRPMNPASVEHALRLEPPAAWAPLWSADQATLTISPTEALRPDTAYRVAIGTAALSQRFRALERPVELHFRTALAPAVVTALPADLAGNVALDSPISLRFSRPIVPAAALMQARQLPELLIDPPLAGRAIWLDQATVLFRPSAPLRPGTHYRATLSATLTDAQGVQLSDPFSWSFSTPPPQVLAVTPADGARLVAPRATLALTVSQPLALTSLRATLAFSPTIAGQLAAVDLADGRQLITYQPTADLLPDTTYTATLSAGAAPVDGNLPLLNPVSWRFTTAPQPALIGRFPGEGQTLPNGQDIRLVFNTPIDREAFGAALRLTPPAKTLRVSSSDSEIRISADLQAATVYTMTLPADLADRNGVALGQEYRIRFTTAPSGPLLELPESAAHLAQIVPGRAASLLIRRTNLSALNADLYQLDESALVRVLGFQDGDWGAFQPERYNQPLLRSWRIPLSDALNTPVEERLPVALDRDQPLPAGAYYLRIRSLEGPRADLLLLATRTRLTPQAGGLGSLIWATDVISGTPVAALPVALYRAGVLVEQGVTDAAGLLRFANPSRVAGASIAVANGAALGVGAVRLDRQAENPRALFVTTDRAAYRPGDLVRLAGFVRATGVSSSTLALPLSGAVELAIRHATSPNRLYQATSALSATGVFSASIVLARDAPPGRYMVDATADGSARQIDFVVQPESSAVLQVAVATPPVVLAGAVAPITVTLRTQADLPVAGATISWTLEAERAPFPQAADAVFGDDDRPPAAIAPRAGVAQSDASGEVGLVLGDLAAAEMPMRYHLSVQAVEPGGLAAAGAGAFVVMPAQRVVGVRVPSRIFSAGARGAIDLIALNAGGQAAPRTTIRVEVYRRVWEHATAADLGAAAATDLVPRDRLAFTRSIATGADGTASLPLTLPSAGAYRLRASVVGAGQPPAVSALTVWASAPGFTGWGDLPGGGPLLIADRPSYRPGDVATLLVTTPLPQADALITVGGSGEGASEVRALQAGTTFTITIQPDAPPQLPVSVLVSAPAPELGAAVAEPPALPAAQALLRVAGAGRPLDVGITADRASYLPGSTAQLTITTSAGAGVPADLLIDIVDAANAPVNRIDPALQPAATGELTGPASAPTLWSPARRSNASGVLTLTLQLPNTPADLRVIVWAAGADRFGQAQSTLAVTQPLSLRAIVPPVYRAGDRVELALMVQNTSNSAQEVDLRLAAAGLQIQPGGPLSQRVQIAPGAATRISWAAQVLDAASVRIGISASAGAQPAQQLQLDAPIVRSAPARAPRDGGVALLREYTDPLTGQPLDLTQLRAGQIVRARLTMVIATAQRGLEVDEPIPAGAEVVTAKPGGFDLVERLDGRLMLTQAISAPGIVQYEYLLRLTAGGSYGIPAASARTADGATGLGNTMQIVVAARS